MKNITEKYLTHRSSFIRKLASLKFLILKELLEPDILLELSIGLPSGSCEYKFLLTKKRFLRKNKEYILVVRKIGGHTLQGKWFNEGNIISLYELSKSTLNFIITVPELFGDDIIKYFESISLYKNKKERKL